MYPSALDSVQNISLSYENELLVHENWSAGETQYYTKTRFETEAKVGPWVFSSYEIWEWDLKNVTVVSRN